MSDFRKLAACTVALSTIWGAAIATADEKPSIVTVVKVTGENWFTRMNEGVTAYGNDNDTVATSQIGPGKADAAQQARLIEDLVAKKVSAIAVVPMDASSLEGVLKRAAQRGIKVVTHEADSMKNTLVDIEAFENKAFGARFNEKIAECMGKSGKWTSFVGSLGSLTHVQWADGGAENAKKYPEMELVSRRTSPSMTPIAPTKRRAKSCASTPTSRASRAGRRSTSSASGARSKRPACRTRPACSASACRRTPLLSRIRRR